MTELNNSSENVARLSLENIKFIENELDATEKISLIFLLSGNPKYSTNEIQSLETVETLSFIQNQSNFDAKLIEGLFLIQNNFLLRTLGVFDNNIQHNIEKFRIILYKICESLTLNETEAVIELIGFEIKRLGVKFQKFAPHLELYFLYLESMDLISVKNGVTFLVRIFENLKFHEICKWLKEIDIEKLESRKILFDRYEINPEKPGAILIVNQENFYREFEEEYKHLLPPPNVRLERRIGTKIDSDRLESTFAKFRFRVCVEKDLNHIDMKKAIITFIESITVESSLFICILSHGDEGVVYGIDSCKIRVTDIQNWIYKRNIQNLSGKPKILILQSCQGQNCQTVPKDQRDILLDGGTEILNNNSNGERQQSEVTSPLTADTLIFWATVPGFAAIRQKTAGTWFIQSLCRKISEYSDNCHFEDICTSIVDDVSAKRWIAENEMAMVPLKMSTLRKHFYLPNAS